MSNSGLNFHGDFCYPELTFCGFCGMHGDGIGGGSVLSDHVFAAPVVPFEHPFFMHF